MYLLNKVQTRRKEIIGKKGTMVRSDRWSEHEEFVALEKKGHK
jgi:hypothetical protein